MNKINDPEIRSLNVGCGGDIRALAINTDIAPGPGVDSVFDLNAVTGWPFEANRFEEIIAIDVLEHLDNPIHFMEEAFRVLKHGYEMTVRVPHYTSRNYNIDLTHKHGYDERSFDYFDPTTELGFKYGAFYRRGCPWRIIRVVRDYMEGNVTVVMRPIKVNEVAPEWQTST